MGRSGEKLKPLPARARHRKPLAAIVIEAQSPARRRGILFRAAADCAARSFHPQSRTKIWYNTQRYE